ncbi:MAG: hypothetical protein AB7P76_10535 [Candidatus Melainabacteria bacterium]
MASGRNKSVKIEGGSSKAPPPITATDYTLPTGDRYQLETRGGQQSLTSALSPDTQGLVGASQTALTDLARSLGQPDTTRARQIARRAQDFFDLQAGGINADSDALSRQAQSTLARRFGGSLNSTFGADLLSRIENDRLNRLSGARKDASLLGEDLFASDEDSRLRRFTLFQNVLGDLNNQARGFASLGSTVQTSDRERVSRLALAQSSLDQDFSNNLARTEAARYNAIGSFVGEAGKLATAFLV